MPGYTKSVKNEPRMEMSQQPAVDDLNSHPWLSVVCRGAPDLLDQVEYLLSLHNFASHAHASISVFSVVCNTTQQHKGSSTGVGSRLML